MPAPGTLSGNHFGAHGSSMFFYWATKYIATETGVNNALIVSLTDEVGKPVVVQAGLRIAVLLAHTLQAGANTIALNGATAVAIKSHLNPANNIATGYAVGGIVELMFDGTRFLDMSQ